MDILWFNQKEDLERWKGRPVHPEVAAGPRPGSYRDSHRRWVAQEAPGDGQQAFTLLAQAIEHYRIFPPRLGKGVCERRVQVGDALGLRYFLLPGLHIFFACRVVDVFHTPLRSGFTYQTLAGHPEVGEETFAVEKDPVTGMLEVSLTAWSHLSRPWRWGMGPFARPRQFAAGRAALDYLESLVEPLRRS
jgi:uncharacterized protein (UPF0548 family)